jgi:hypothetical protein
VSVLVADVVGVCGGVDECVVELGLADICLEAIYLFEGGVGVEGK